MSCKWQKSREILAIFGQDKITMGDVALFYMDGRRPPRKPLVCHPCCTSPTSQDFSAYSDYAQFLIFPYTSLSFHFPSPQSGWRGEKKVEG